MSHFYKNLGFTLTEFIVTLSILTLILAVVVSNQSRYTDGIALTQSADEMGSIVSQAQAFSLGVRELTPGSAEFTASYGLAFNLSGTGSNTSYIYYADINPKNGIYDGTWACTTGGTNECIQKPLITRGNVISSVCIVLNGGSDNCAIDRIYITFSRPKTEAQLMFYNGGSQVNEGNAIGAKIVLMSPKGSTRNMVVYKTGQISVQ